MKEYKNIEEFHKDYLKFAELNDREFIDFIEKNFEFIESIENDQKSLKIKFTILCEYGITLIRYGNYSMGKNILIKGFFLIDKDWKVEEFEDTPYNEKLLWNYGLALSELNENREAESVFKHLVKLYPDNEKYKAWTNSIKNKKISKIKNPLWIIFLVWFILKFLIFDNLSSELKNINLIFGILLLTVILSLDGYNYFNRQKIKKIKKAYTNNNRYK